MADLEAAISMIMDVFARYAGTHGSRRSLSKEELRLLLEKELPGFLESGKDDAMDKLFRGLDTSEDSTVSFQEFVLLVAGLTAACHKHFQEEGTS
ncbi:protein S100-P [Eptesicus fuscus]|uniref:protein S100-P n=1 Tax=Eptesicus fuscus TaxID=29078 RepID=UPI00240432AE|nr:protein S100-P [Eptesicus fuscus]